MICATWLVPPVCSFTTGAHSGLTGWEAENLYRWLLNIPQVCTTTLGCTSVLKHRIKLKSDVVVTQRTIDCHYKRREDCKGADGWDAPAQDHCAFNSPWASQIVLVPKKDDESRLCVGEHGEADAYPLPTISEMWHPPLLLALLVKMSKWGYKKISHLVNSA